MIIKWNIKPLITLVVPILSLPLFLSRTPAQTHAHATNWAAAKATVRKIPITVRNPLPGRRTGEPVKTGIPIPKGELKDLRKVRLTRKGDEVPAQFRITGLWRPTNYIRWILVDFQTDIGSEEKQRFILEYGNGIGHSAKTENPVRIRQNAMAYIVDTGPSTFKVSKKQFTLFEEVRLKDGTVIAGPHQTRKAQYGAFLRGLRPTVTRTIPSPQNKGEAHLIYVKNLGGATQEDYTLSFVTNKQFAVYKAGDRPVGRGSYRTDFTSKGNKISIPAEAWLAHHLPKKGDMFSFRTIPEGATLASCGVFDTAILERGPLRSVLRVKGSFGPPAAPLLEYTARYHFYAGSSRVKLSFTLENNDHGGRTNTGNARNANIGGINCVFFDEMVLQLPISAGKHCTCSLSGDTRKWLRTSLNQKVELYQDSNGGPNWDRYKGPEYHPRPNSYVTFKGYRLYRNGKTAGKGDRAAGCLQISTHGGGVTVTVRDFWQNFPKALSADQRGKLEIGLFPGRYGGDFAFRSGEHKTHEVLFSFYQGKRPISKASTAARGFSCPLRAEPPSSWFAETRALGYLHPFDPADYPAYEIRNLSTIGVFPPGVKPGESLLKRREETDFYGWMDYGDVPIDFESGIGQWGLKYDFDLQMAKQYARTLRTRWWSLFASAAKHIADIDIHHQPHYPSAHFVKGGVWAHSLHNEKGNLNPNRNYNHFTKDLAFGGLGTAAFYYMTGYWKARQACLEIAENALARYMSPQQDPGPPEDNNRMGVRGDACTLNRLLAGYMLSGCEKYLRHARWQVKSCAFNGRPPKHKPVSLWSSVFYMMALIRYVEAFPQDTQAKNWLLAHLYTLRKSVTEKHGIYYTVTPKPGGSVEGKGSCSHYNIMASDALAYGYRLTGERSFMKTARRCFAYGVKNACWEGGPPTYVQVHSANGATHGNLFMAVDSKLREKGK